jgi:hypothetical protein
MHDPLTSKWYFLVTALAPGTAVAHSTRAAAMRREHRRRDIATLISLLISVCLVIAMEALEFCIYTGDQRFIRPQDEWGRRNLYNPRSLFCLVTFSRFGVRVARIYLADEYDDEHACTRVASTSRFASWN